MSVTKGGEEKKHVKCTNTQEKCDFQLKNLCLKDLDHAKTHRFIRLKRRGKERKESEAEAKAEEGERKLQSE